MKKKLSKQASPDSYDFTIGRTKNVKTDASVGAEQIDQGFDDFDQVRYTVVRKFAILVSFGILVVFMALELQANARIWYSH